MGHFWWKSCLRRLSQEPQVQSEESLLENWICLFDTKEAAMDPNQKTFPVSSLKGSGSMCPTTFHSWHRTVTSYLCQSPLLNRSIYCDYSALLIYMGVQRVEYFLFLLCRCPEWEELHLRICNQGVSFGPDAGDGILDFEHDAIIGQDIWGFWDGHDHVLNVSRK